MANTVTFSGLTTIMHRAMDRVARERTGVIPSAMINSSGVTAGHQGESVQSIRTGEAIEKASYTPAMSVPDSGDKTDTVESITLSEYDGAELPLTGENTKKLNNIGLYGQWIEDSFAQMIRNVNNKMEAYMAGVVAKGASRAVGTAGTTPFGSDMTVLSAAYRVLEDNGCPMEDGELSAVINSAAGQNVRDLANLYKVNESGDTRLLRQGVMGDLYGFMLRTSAGIQSHTKGTGTGYITNGGEPLKEITISVDTGSGTVVAGDVITFAGDTNKYVVKTGIAAPGDLVINYPGMREAVGDGVALTIGDSFTGNLAFHRQAVEFAARAPALPEGGDASEDSIMVVDPLTGFTYEFRLYKGYGMNKIELNMFYGGKVWKPEFTALILG